MAALHLEAVPEVSDVRFVGADLQLVPQAAPGLLLVADILKIANSEPRLLQHAELQEGVADKAGSARCFEVENEKQNAAASSGLDGAERPHPAAVVLREQRLLPRRLR